jgi:catechol 2,3-dioxygenase-like lactoylglutathione lyase family enzyme
MDLAKPCLDVGLYVDDAQASRSFYEGELGLAYEELLPVGGGVRQHRLGLRGSVLKLNESRTPADRAPTAYRRLLIATSDGAPTADLVDPDGLAVSLVAPNTYGIVAIGIDVVSSDPDAHGRFYADGMGAKRVDHDVYQLGTTVIRVIHDARAERAGPLPARGFRYLTVQVRDVAREHDRIIGLGFEEAMPPRKLGEVAAISFVRDPGGNWVEISQRASLTGDLPEHV